MFEFLFDKKRITTITVSVVVCGSLVCGHILVNGIDNNSPQVNPTMPSVEMVGGSVRELGELTPGSSYVGTFELENTSAQRVVLDPSVRTSCGCTHAVLSDIDLKPGERSSIEIGLSVPAANLSRQIVTCIIHSQSPKAAYPFKVAFSVKLPWTIRPHQMRIEGMPRSRAQADLYVHTQGNANLRVLEVNTDKELKVLRIDKLENGNYVVELSAQIPNSPNVEYRKVAVRTDDPHLPVQNANVVLIPVEEYRVVPKQLVFSHFTNEAVEKQRIALRSEHRFSIVDVRSKDVSVECNCNHVSIGDDNVWQADCYVSAKKPSDTQRRLAGKVLIDVLDDAGMVTTVDVPIIVLH